MIPFLLFLAPPPSLVSGLGSACICSADVWTCLCLRDSCSPALLLQRQQGCAVLSAQHLLCNGFESLLCTSPNPRGSARASAVSSGALDSERNRQRVRERGSLARPVSSPWGSREEGGHSPFAARAQLCLPAGSYPPGPAGKPWEPLRKICDFSSLPVLLDVLAVAASSCSSTGCMCLSPLHAEGPSSLSIGMVPAGHALPPLWGRVCREDLEEEQPCANTAFPQAVSLQPQQVLRSLLLMLLSPCLVRSSTLLGVTDLPPPGALSDVCLLLHLHPEAV